MSSAEMLSLLLEVVEVDRGSVGSDRARDAPWFYSIGHWMRELVCSSPSRRTKR